MAIKVIKNYAVDLTAGEKKLLDRIKEIYKNINYEAYLYIQPKIGGLVPDFILIDAKKGVSILEVKDWEIAYVRDIDKRKVKLIDREDDNPVFKTKKYLTILEALVAMLDDEVEFLDDYLYANTVLTNIKYEETIKTGMIHSLKNDSVRCITSELVSKLEINTIFSNEDINLTSNDMVVIRTLLFPEIKIQKPPAVKANSNVKPSIFSLTEEQESFIRRSPYGPYVVSGLPGSGKSIMAISRAVHLIKENPDWKVAIVTFNKSLCTKLECELNRITKEISSNAFYRDVPVENITVTTFHKLAKSIVNTSVVENTDREWWDVTLPNTALEIAKPVFNSIIIDEYQDFMDSWIKLMIKLCKPYKYLNNDKKEVTGVNLFMAGDRLQSINNPKPHRWASDFGINLQGRGKILKVPYRTTKPIITLGLEILHNNSTLSKEVDKYYDKSNGELANDSKGEDIEFIEGSIDTVANTITKLIDDGYKYNDILVICRSQNECEEITKLLPDNIRTNTVFASKANDEQMRESLITSTYHSSKGLESKVVIIVGTDQFSNQLDKNKEILERKVLYVGITRASEKLIIHAKNFQKESYAKDLREIYSTKLCSHECLV